MPPRKSDASKAAAAATATGDEAAPAISKEVVPSAALVGLNIEDFNLPKSIVTRLAKGVLPPNTQIQGNAMLAMTKSATVFVNYLASHANEQAAAKGRKTIMPQDVFEALDDLEFPDFRPGLEAELAKYMEISKEKKASSKAKAATKAGGSDDVEPDEGGGESHGEEEDDGKPAAKKPRREEPVPKGHKGSGRAQPEDEGEEEGEEEPEEEENEDEGEERLEVEEQGDEEEEVEERDDEALDNGEDSE